MSDPGTISLVLRLVGRAVAGGRFVGQVEVVATGELVAVRDADDLVDLAHRLAGGPPQQVGETGTDPPTLPSGADRRGVEPSTMVDGAHI